MEKKLVPDGAFTLKQGERAALFFLEVDRGTEPVTGRHPSAVERKLTRYRAAYEARGEEKFERLFQTRFNGFRILCIVPHQARRDAFIHLARRLDLAPLVWTTTTNLLEGQGNPDAKRWSVTKPGDLHRLSE